MRSNDLRLSCLQLASSDEEGRQQSQIPLSSIRGGTTQAVLVRAKAYFSFVNGDRIRVVRKPRG